MYLIRNLIEKLEIRSNRQTTEQDKIRIEAIIFSTKLMKLFFENAFGLMIIQSKKLDLFIACENANKDQNIFITSSIIGGLIVFPVIYVVDNRIAKANFYCYQRFNAITRTKFGLKDFYIACLTDPIINICLSLIGGSMLGYIKHYEDKQSTICLIENSMYGSLALCLVLCTIATIEKFCRKCICKEEDLTVPSVRIIQPSMFFSSSGPSVRTAFHNIIPQAEIVDPSVVEATVIDASELLPEYRTNGNVPQIQL